MGVNVNFKDGGSFVHLPPQFSSNSQNVFVAWKNKILSYNTRTGQLIGNYEGLTAKIVGFNVHYYDDYECITACSKNGEVITWKTVTYFKVFNKRIAKGNVRTFNVFVCNDEIKGLFSYVESSSVYVSLFNLNTDECENLKLCLKPDDYYIGVSRNNFFAVVQKNKVYFKKVDSPISSQQIAKGRTFTCIACHPERELVLTGDDTGRIVMWQNLFKTNKIQTVYHWHTLPVKCVGFSSSGTYFFSGGAECVLVKWQIDCNLEKKFLPRLSSMITQITVSSDNTLTAVATFDNCIKVIDGRLTDVCNIQNMVIGDQFKCGLNFDSRTKSLVMNGNIGYLQFYSPTDKSLLYNIDIVGQNKITNERNCNMVNTEITKIAISDKGLWLSTVEEWIDSDRDLLTTLEIRLKFWLFNSTKQTFVLNTSVESPHKKSVNAIAYQPRKTEQDLKCVTVADDKTFQIWQLTKIDAKQMWCCLANGNHRSLPAKALSFTTDGSVFAVGFGAIATCWLPDTCELKCSLVHPNYNREDVKQLEFGQKSQSHLLVVVQNSNVIVWNLLNLCASWQVSIQTHLLIASPFTTEMALVTQNNRVIVFSPASHTHIFSSTDLLRNHGKLMAATFVPSKNVNNNVLKWHERLSLWFIDENKELYSIGANDDTESPFKFDEITESLYVKTQPKINANFVSESIQNVTTDSGKDNVLKKLFDTPINLLPPMETICFEILKTMTLVNDEDIER